MRGMRGSSWQINFLFRICGSSIEKAILSHCWTSRGNKMWCILFLGSLCMQLPRGSCLIYNINIYNLCEVEGHVGIFTSVEYLCKKKQKVIMVSWTCQLRINYKQRECFLQVYLKTSTHKSGRVYLSKLLKM